MIKISDRTKELILKTLMVIGMILMFMVFPGSIFWTMLIQSEEIATFVIYIIFFTMLGVGILFMILLPIFGGLKQKPIKAEKVPLVFASYNEFLDFLQMRLLQKEYHLQKKVPKNLHFPSCIPSVQIPVFKSTKKLDISVLYNYSCS